MDRWDGRERFAVGGESAEAEAERLARWNEFLGGEEDDSDKQSDKDDGEDNYKGGMEGVADEEDVEATDTDKELDSGAETE